MENIDRPKRLTMTMIHTATEVQVLVAYCPLEEKAAVPAEESRRSGKGKPRRRWSKAVNAPKEGSGAKRGRKPGKSTKKLELHEGKHKIFDPGLEDCKSQKQREQQKALKEATVKAGKKEPMVSGGSNACFKCSTAI